MSLLQLPKDKYAEIQRMTDFNRVSYFTSFHQNREVYLDPQFNMHGSFSEALLSHNMLLMAGKIGLITGASAGFGFATAWERTVGNSARCHASTYGLCFEGQGASQDPQHSA